MANLLIKVKEKKKLQLLPIVVYFLRGESNTRFESIPFKNGVGQNVVVGTVLKEEGTEGIEGYLKVTINETKTLVDSGTIAIKVENYPNIYQSNKSITYTIDNGEGTIDVVYDSKPEATLIEIEKENRTNLIFTANDFLSHIVIASGTTINSISLSGDVTGFKQIINNVLTDYVEDTFILIDDINIGKLVYIPDDVDNYYEKEVVYKVKDSNGNISN